MKKLLLILLFVCEMGQALGWQPRIGTSLASLAQWPRYRANNQSTGLGLGSGAAGFVTWSIFDNDGSFHSPSIGQDGTVYVGNDDWALYAINPTDGSMKWGFPTNGPVQSTPAIGPNGWLYFGSDDNNIYAVDSATGTVEWVVPTGGYVTGSPVIGANGDVFVGSQDGVFYALDGSSGSELWSFDASLYVGLPDEFFSSPGLNSAGDIVVADFLGNVFELDPTAGNVLATFNGTVGNPSSVAIDSGDNVLLSLPGSEFLSLNSNLQANFGVPSPTNPGFCSTIDSSNNSYTGLGSAGMGQYTEGGAAGWANSIGISSPPILGADGTIYVGDTSNNFDALNGSNGNILWQIPSVTVNESAAIGRDGSLYFADSVGNFYKVGAIQYRLTLAPTQVSGGNSSLATIALTYPAPSGGYTVNLQSNNAAASVPGSVLVQAGNSQVQFKVTTSGVSTTQSATISASIGADTTTAFLTLTPAIASNFYLSPAAVTGGNTTTGVFQLQGAAAAKGFVVPLSSGSADAVVPSSITVPGGKSGVTFTVTTSAVSASENVTITATVTHGDKTTYPITLTLYPYPIANFYTSPSTVAGGEGVRAVVQLLGPAGSSSEAVSLQSSDGNATVPSTVSIPAGTSGASFAITTLAVQSSDAVTLTATLGASTLQTTLVVRPYQIKVFYVSPSSLIGGQVSRGYVYLEGPAGGDVINLQSGSTDAAVPGKVATNSSGAATFAIHTSAVASQESVTITATLGSQSVQSSLAINPPSISNFYLAASTVTGGLSTTLVVQLNGPAPSGGAAVAIDTGTGGGSTVAVNSPLTIPGGAGGASTTVRTAAVSSSQTFTLTATYGSSSANTSLTLNPVAMNDFYVSPTTVTGGQNSFGVVQLNAPSGPGSIVVSLSSADPNVSFPSSLTFNPGQTGLSFVIRTSRVASSDAATITATYGSTMLTATVNLSP